MYDIFVCIRDQHDWGYVALAALICVMSTITAVLLLRHARHYPVSVAARWIVGAGVSIGFGIWATHFVAMLGYDPGIAAGYRVPATAGSLAIAILMTTLSFAVCAMKRNRAGLTLAAALGGGGIAAMHYLGMSAVELPARMEWRMDYVVLSIALGIALIYPALKMAARGRNLRSGLGAALLMTAAIVVLHFTGMAAITLIPEAIDARTTQLLTPLTMAAMIGTGSLALLAICFAALMVSRQARATIHAQERDLSILVKGVTDCAIYMLDKRGRVANWNPGAERLKGYTAQEAIGMRLAQFYSPEDREAEMPSRALAQARDTGKFTDEGWRVRRDGTRFWAHVTMESIANGDGEHVGFAKITRDMTRFKEDRDQLTEMARHLDAALGNMHQGLCLFDADQRLVLVNARFKAIWGLDADACAPGSTLEQVARAALESRVGASIPQDRIDNMRVLLASSLADPASQPVISDFSDNLVVSIITRPLPDGGFVTTFEDVTDRQRAEEKITHMAMHDSLTGLPNRPSFNHWLDTEIAKAGQFGRQLAVVMIDLDRFKEINDTRGHGAGDEALQALSRRLVDTLADGEIVARLGGDEFAAAKVFAQESEVSGFLQRLAGCFTEPFGTDDNTFHLGASLGVSVFPEDGEAREQILNNADLAMYRAKSSLTENIAYYRPEMDETARERRQLANDLRQAIERNELSLLYQPQHDLKSGLICGYEALLRWSHAQKGAISPDDFIPIAEETGEIFRIGEWVLREACREAQSWSSPIKIAVNLSAVQLMQHDLVDLVARTLLDTGLSPRRLELEITETAIIGDKLRALHCLRQIKALGVSIAMDDFGTGYSSLDTLHSFPFDKIKIDKSFLLRSQNSEDARAIIRAVLALGQSLKVPVLAEGVETSSQLDLLEQEGCTQVQGYYFGRPEVPPSTLYADDERMAG
jgi:diguanylate cyclase (GGDEF)-like protein/PAS domain S-box-containing protein